MDYTFYFTGSNFFGLTSFADILIGENCNDATFTYLMIFSAVRGRERERAHFISSPYFQNNRLFTIPVDYISER